MRKQRISLLPRSFVPAMYVLVHFGHKHRSRLELHLFAQVLHHRNEKIFFCIYFGV
jgi:hypothetical protein